MTASDIVFAGSIPALYDRYLGPLLFAPFAADLAARAAALAPRRILETAAGTGIVTEAVAEVLPEAEIVATDLNQAMLVVAAVRAAAANVRFEAADAQSLPFPDAAFDLVVSQFGVMFFPDRVGAYREAKRVLKPGGAFLFNAWDAVEENPVSAAVVDALQAWLPRGAESFFRRIPFGYHDQARIEADLRGAGFAEVVIETVRPVSRVSARDAAIGLCQGTPLRAEIEQHGLDLAAATDAAAAALASFDGADAPMSAHVIVAR